MIWCGVLRRRDGGRAVTTLLSRFFGSIFLLIGKKIKKKGLVIYVACDMVSQNDINVKDGIIFRLPKEVVSKANLAHAISK